MRDILMFTAADDRFAILDTLLSRVLTRNQKHAARGCFVFFFQRFDRFYRFLGYDQIMNRRLGVFIGDNGILLVFIQEFSRLFMVNNIWNTFFITTPL